MLKVENDNSHPENKEPNHEIFTQIKLILMSLGIFPENGIQDLDIKHTRCIYTIHCKLRICM